MLFCAQNMLKHKIDSNVRYSSNTVQNPRLNSIDLFCTAGSTGFHALNCIQNSHNGYQLWHRKRVKKLNFIVDFIYLSCISRPALSLWFALILHITKVAARVIMRDISRMCARVRGAYWVASPRPPFYNQLITLKRWSGPGSKVNCGIPHHPPSTQYVLPYIYHQRCLTFCVYSVVCVCTQFIS